MPDDPNKELAAMRGAVDALGKRIDEMGGAKKDAASSENGDGTLQAILTAVNVLNDKFGSIEGRLATLERHNGDENGEAFGDDAGGGDMDPNLDGELAADGAPRPIAGHESPDQRGVPGGASDRQARAAHDALNQRVTDALAEAHSRADEVAQVHGQRADRPMYGEMPGDYIRRQLRRWAKYSSDHKSTNFDTVRDPRLLRVIEGQVFKDAKAAAYLPDAVPAGQLREIVETDRSGRRISKFYGATGAWMDAFKIPPMRVRRINTQTDRG